MAQSPLRRLHPLFAVQLLLHSSSGTAAATLAPFGRSPKAASEQHRCSDGSPRPCSGFVRIPAAKSPLVTSIDMDALLRFLPAFAQVDMTRIFLGVIALGLIVGFAYWFFYRPRKGAVEQPAVLPSPVHTEVPSTPEQPVPEVIQDPALTRGTATNMNPTMMSESLQPSESAADVEPFVGGSSEASPYGDHE